MASASASLLDGTPDGAAFGEFLRQARERRGLTLQQISSETKIPWRHLQALEHGQLNAVPGGPYRRGEIRAYAEAVGLDKAMALERLDRALQASTATVAPPPRMPSRSRRGFSLLLVAVSAFAGAGLSTVWGRVPPRRPPPPARTEPLVAGRLVTPGTLLPLPIVQPDVPAAGAVAAISAGEAGTPASPVDGDLTI